MIVIDTSALLAIFFDETEKTTFVQRIMEEDRSVLSTVNAHEAMTVARVRRGEFAVGELRSLITELRIELRAFDEPQVSAAVEAFNRFGKGIHSKARLNICDCVAYALAKALNAPLLFKGDDFPHTDIAAAV